MLKKNKNKKKKKQGLLLIKQEMDFIEKIICSVDFIYIELFTRIFKNITFYF